MSADVARMLHEIGHLERVPRSGWTLLGIPAPESVAEHSFRTAVIAAFLAVREGADPARAALLALFHDVAETRVQDAHRVAQRYFDKGRAESAVRNAQCSALPDDLGRWWRSLDQALAARADAESRLVKDADALECLLHAHEYSAQGFDTSEWVESSLARLGSETAKSWARAILEGSPHDWFRHCEGGQGETRDDAGRP